MTYWFSFSFAVIKNKKDDRMIERRTHGRMDTREEGLRAGRKGGRKVG